MKYIYKTKEEIRQDILKKYKPKIFAYKKEGIYFGIELNFCIYAYGRDFDNVIERIGIMLNRHITGAIERNKIKDFIPYKAPFTFIYRYYKTKFLLYLGIYSEEDYIAKGIEWAGLKIK